ncbi:hypothetical protein [Salinigranum sp. GCM10025319]|uniref:hypothetical protein n=1 Tax=Salinigranum sp. GCM10025319 TaxID=3252687 RepID=UPI00361D75F1
MNADADVDADVNADADVDSNAGPPSDVDVGADGASAATTRDESEDGLGRRLVVWYAEWYLRFYAILSVCIVLAAGYGYAIGALSWWNAGGMVVVLAALTLFVQWRRGVDPAFGANEQ